MDAKKTAVRASRKLLLYVKMSSAACSMQHGAFKIPYLGRPVAVAFGHFLSILCYCKSIKIYIEPTPTQTECAIAAASRRAAEGNIISIYAALRCKVCNAFLISHRHSHTHTHTD